MHLERCDDLLLKTHAQYIPIFLERAIEKNGRLEGFSYLESGERERNFFCIVFMYNKLRYLIV